MLGTYLTISRNRTKISIGKFITYRHLYFFFTLEVLLHYLTALTLESLIIATALKYLRIELTLETGKMVNSMARAR